MSSARFREFLYPDSPDPFAELRTLDAYGYREQARTDDFRGGLIRGWEPLYDAPFRGVTNDGNLREGLYGLGELDPAERAPVEAMVAAARRLLAVLTDEQRERIAYDIDGVEWQRWANPEFMQFDNGLRLEFVAPEIREAAMDLVEASLSPTGAETARNMMRLNAFLGEVVELPGILNEYSYNVALFGEPDPVRPWGWQLYGHHCAVNVLLVDGRMVVSPVFFGAEPNEFDAGEFAGTATLEDRVTVFRDVMATLRDHERRVAVLYDDLNDPAMPEGRVHPGDERHLAGAFQDNRVIPYEGLALAGARDETRAAALEIARVFSSFLPDGPLARRLREIEAHLDETHVCWIGGTGPDDPFYARLQSPVAIFEVDHHCGVFLDYDTPKVFHIHTLVRTPNGNDYGRAIVREFERRDATARAADATRAADA